MLPEPPLVPLGILAPVVPVAVGLGLGLLENLRPGLLGPSEVRVDIVDVDVETDEVLAPRLFGLLNDPLGGLASMTAPPSSSISACMTRPSSPAIRIRSVNPNARVGQSSAAAPS